MIDVDMRKTIDGGDQKIQSMQSHKLKKILDWKNDENNYSFFGDKRYIDPLLLKLDEECCNDLEQ